MDLDFKICRIKQGSKSYDIWSRMGSLKDDTDSDMILIGEEYIDKERNYQLIPIEDDSVKLISGLNLTDTAYLIPVEDVILSNKKYSFDIPKEFLDLDIVDNIHRINS